MAYPKDNQQNGKIKKWQNSTWQQDTITAIEEATEWGTCWQDDSSNYSREARTRTRAQRSQWNRPSRNFLKCNYDCKYAQGGNATQTGWIFRDPDGFFVRAGISKGDHCSSEKKGIFDCIIGLERLFHGNQGLPLQNSSGQEDTTIKLQIDWQKKL
ncbi:predicted protein [Arabidopsis lyrata subsp. lyrata]|uniref:Predicted protein n=1 Tax=Arabidopsis lyrata subsp. lyrata TaxID=81972 RepID=D7MMA6_ARALL|nr:predicted protein [Arabidopsis lyrata subsp. lyrata]